ncbi:MAG TPA: hypothetical protein ENI79_05800 [Rhodospirillales bacterium]|nr:hypothetical protein [Rhodospirillales bacterium]
MCFSEPVSFAAGSALIAGGAFASWKAWKISKKYMPIALMPVMAGIQQFMEGYVWMGLSGGDSSMVWLGAMGFIFFSWLLWPIWIPFSVYVLEPPESRRKNMFLYFALAGTALGLALYIPHLLYPDWVNVTINRDSLAYEGTMLLDYLIPRWLTYAIYMFLLIAPPLMSTYLHIRLFGLTLIAIVSVVYFFLVYAYISFFCLLAGIGTLHLIYIILRNKCCRECPTLFS